MNTLHEAQSRWAAALSRPWSEAKLVGSTLEAHGKLVQLLEQSVNLQDDGRGGECISALLIGPSGVGKTFIVKTAIESLRASGHQVIPITLHGSICSDDKSSMRQIFSQFQRQLLGGSSLDSFSRVNFRLGSLSEWCARLAQLLQECARSDHMVVITLEDFDEFCHCKSKQSLLYNLLDLMHLKDTRFVVIGVTRRPDATELLEKRIKSRFQLRKILVSPPHSLAEMAELVGAAIIPTTPVITPVAVSRIKTRGKSKRAEVESPQNSDVASLVAETLGSKELMKHWSLYRDMGYSSHEFVTAALTQLQFITEPSQIPEALVSCMHKYEAVTLGDTGVMSTVLSSLTLREHIVLVGLLKLHQYGKRPKCFAHVLKEIGSFEKRNACSSLCRHSKRAYWHAFKGLVRVGLIELVEYGGVSSAVAPPPIFTRCRLTIVDSYKALFRNVTEKDGPLAQIPNEVHQWASETKSLGDNT